MNKETIHPTLLFILKYVLPVILSLLILIFSIYLPATSKLAAYENTVEYVFSSVSDREIDVEAINATTSSYLLSSKIFAIKTSYMHTHAVLINMIGFSGPVVGVFGYNAGGYPEFIGIAGVENPQVDPAQFGLTDHLIHFWALKVSEICSRVILENEKL